MRCPKCGYISFDHLEECRKCNKNIATTSAGLPGSTYNIQVPTFLVLDRELREESSPDMDLAEEQSFAADDEYVDEELAVLVEDEDDVEEGAINFSADAPAGKAPAGDDDVEDSEIEIDFSQFEESDEEADLHQADAPQQHQKMAHDLKIDIPPALSDISDLAPPGQLSGQKASPGAAADPDFSELDLDTLDFDLGLDGLDDAAKKSPVAPAPANDTFSLDELDFADALADSDPAPVKKTEDLDLDLDLDFELDLGGLSIHKDV